MRKIICCLFLLVGIVPFLNADPPPGNKEGGVRLIPEAELPTPKKLPPPATLFNQQGKTDTRFDMDRLQQELEQLRKEREALEAARSAPSEEPPRDEGGSTSETAKLRLRLAELLARTGALTRSRRADVAPQPPPFDPATPGKPLDPKTEPSTRPDTASATDTGKPVDSLALANALFGAGDYEGALKAYGQVNLTGMRPDERVPVQYLIATCLRRQGKTDEAAKLYREIAGSKGDEMVAELAQWQLQSMRWRRDMEEQIKDLRQRRGKEVKP
jgi:hypothetical protein